MRDLPLFEELKAINPNKRYQLETVTRTASPPASST
jgi:hypothetical protein